MKPLISRSLLLSAVLLTSACQNETSMVATAQPENVIRKVVPFASGWTFLRTDELPQGIHQPDFFSADAQQITVPHNWNRVGYYLDDSGNHSNTKDNTDLFQGIGLYRYQFSLEKQAGERNWIEFDAASRVAKVWVNGRYVGEHRGSFNRFRFDITDALNENGPNVMVVQVDNTKPTATSSTGDTLPIAGDFFVHGGLYRDVRLISTSSTHIALNDFGGPGVYLTSQPDGEGATVEAKVLISNQGNEESPMLLRSRIFDASGKLVAESEQNVAITVGSTKTFSQSLAFSSARRWQGLEDPYLYTVDTELVDANGSITDRVKQKIGIRSLDITADNQVMLNGKPVMLRGTGYHQDREGKGWAVSPEDIEQDMQMLVDMGANSVRLAHYPHGQAVHQLADEMGLILWDEIPLVSAWRYGEKNQQVNQALADNASLQLTEMVKQNYNHPSVAVWGIANEVDFGAVVPMFVQSEPGSNPDPVPLLQRLQKEVSVLDSSRDSTLANCCAGVPTWDQANVPETSDITDTTGANRYYGWYYGQPEGLGKNLDDLHATYPQQPFAITEYGAGGATTFHTDNPLGGPVAATGRNQPEEYMSYVHEKNWEQIDSKDYLWGAWIWNGFDFATTTRREGDSQDINTKGLITYDRQIRKDPYFFYQANWTTEPMVHVTSQRYVERAYQVTDITAYSNADEVTLWVNGESSGVLSDCDMNICTWHAVRLAEGDNAITVTGTGRYDGKAYEVSSSAQWTLAADQVNQYRIDAGAIMAAKTTSLRYGSDNFFEGGYAATLDKAGGWGRPPVKATINSTSERELAASYRAGTFSYTLPVDNGLYKVTVLSVVPENTPVNFDVIYQDKPLFTGVGKAVPSLSATENQAEVNVTDGKLVLNFRPNEGEAVVSAISVEPVNNQSL